MWTTDLVSPDATALLDLRKPQDLQVLERFPDNIGCVVLNAGRDSLPGKGLQSPLDVDSPDWLDFFSVNVIGAMSVVSALEPKLCMGARIIFVGSLYGLVSPRVTPYRDPNGSISYKHPAYGASKSALLTIMRQLSTHYEGTYNFSMISPGIVEAGQPPEFRGPMTANVPAGHFLKASEVANYLELLVNPNLPALNGHNLVIDGGYTLW